MAAATSLSSLGINSFEHEAQTFVEYTRQVRDY